MKRTAFLLSLLVTLTAAASASAQEAPYDDAASESLTAWVGTLFAAFQSTATLDIAYEHEELTLWDVNESGPWEMRGVVAWAYLAGTLVQLTTQRGITWEYTLTATNCHAATGLGYCAVEYVVLVDGGGMDVPPTAWRTTVVARQVDGVWTLVHLHTSLAGTADAE